MKIEKIGHCCLLIEIDGVRILTDPGSFTVRQDEIEKLDAIIISHEHGDHLHVDSLKRVIARNPQALVITNTGVGAILTKEGIVHVVIDGTSQTSVKNIVVEAFDCKHEEIFQEIGQVQNTGYFIGKLFYPGDAFARPGREVEVLALPVAGPWCKIPDAIRYALSIKPRASFPVHDGVLRDMSQNSVHALVQMILQKNGINFTPLQADQTAEF